MDQKPSRHSVGRLNGLSAFGKGVRFWPFFAPLWILPFLVLHLIPAFGAEHDSVRGPIDVTSVLASGICTGIPYFRKHVSYLELVFFAFVPFGISCVLFALFL